MEKRPRWEGSSRGTRWRRWGNLEEGEVVLLEGVGGRDTPEEEVMVCAELPQ